MHAVFCLTSDACARKFLGMSTTAGEEMAPKKADAPARRFSGAKLRELRDRKGLSRRDVMLALHGLGESLAERTLVNYENDESVPDMNLGLRLAQVLGVSFDDFLV
jgi:DNA-binding XRE family transcriptional regulator